jgi:hypothetical protein
LAIALEGLPLSIHHAFVTDTTRVLLSAAILIYFGWALVWHYNTGLEEALKNVLLIVVGFWLGGAKRIGGDDKQEPKP